MRDMIAQENLDNSGSLHVLSRFIFWDKSHLGFQFRFSEPVSVFYFKRAFIHNYSNYLWVYSDVKSAFM